MAVKRTDRRSQNGTAITEFAASLVIFVCVLFVPLINMAFVPARYLLVHTYLNNVVRQMALSEKRSDAVRYLNSNSWKKVIESFGVNLKSAKVTLLVCNNTGDTKLSLVGQAPVPAQSLPHNDGEIRLYSLELACDIDVPPLFKGSAGLPGFNSPVAFTFKNRAQWENLCPNPITGDFYINE